MLRSYGLIVVLSCFLCVRDASAQCVVNISTGYDDLIAGVVAAGDEDPRYIVDAGFGPLAAFTGGAEQLFPVPPWVDNTEESLWISSSPNAVDAPAISTYEILIEVPAGTDLENLAIVGRWAVDDTAPVPAVSINGRDAGIPTAAGFASWTQFPPGAGLGLFLEGENVITFSVENHTGNPDPNNPVGLRVEACLEVVELATRPFDISSGFDRSEGRRLTDGESSDDYVISGPLGENLPATAVDSTSFPFPAWVANGAQSRWIGPSEAEAVGPVGSYVFRTEVALDGGVDASRAILSGSFAVDDEFSDIWINGKSTGLTGIGSGLLQRFPAEAGLGLFVAGANTIEFIVGNGAEGPVGLRVDAVVDFVQEIAAPPSLFSIDTGFDNATGVTIANGGADDNYIVVAPGASAQFATIVPDDLFPIGPWIGSTANSKWIGVDAPSSNGPTGTFIFRITVTLPEDYDAKNAKMLGTWSSDNGVSDVVINGLATGITHGGNFGALEPIPLDAGLGFFQTGDNLIELFVTNAEPDGNPMGLRVEGVVGTGIVDPADLSTGIDSRGVGPLPPGLQDSRYVVTGPDGEEIGPRRSIVVTPQPSWVENTATSKWVGLDGDDSSGPAGTYTYTVEFELPISVAAHRTAITGRWSAAGNGTDVVLNDESLGPMAPGPDSWNDFSSDMGLGIFRPGLNVLTFVVENGTSGPTALRVEALRIVVVKANSLDISTGFDQTNGVVLEVGELDEDYLIIDTLGFKETATVPFGAPIPPWLADSASSRWIGLAGAEVAEPGEYIYQTTVGLTAEQAAEAALVGFWTFDDGAVDVRINENSVGLPAPVVGFNAPTYFPADAGTGLFEEGINIIEFVIRNDGLAGNPSGLRVDAFVGAGDAPEPDDAFVRADADGSGAINITDGIFVLNFLFLGGEDPPCKDAADADDSGVINITDGIFILNFLFLGGLDPRPPHPACGIDTTPSEAIDCNEVPDNCI